MAADACADLPSDGCNQVIPGMDLTPEQLLAGASGLSFLGGWLLCVLLTGGKARRSADGESRDHQIRNLDADLRVARRKLEDLNAQDEAHKGELIEALAERNEFREQLKEQNDLLQRLKHELQAALRKTDELRQELTERASENIREHVRAREISTELDVMQAGSEAVLQEINRLQAEREELTDTVRMLKEQLFGDEPDLQKQA